MKNEILKDAKWQRGGKQRVLRTYLQLHEYNLGAHWLWLAMERIAAGESEANVMAQFGFCKLENEDFLIEKENYQ